MIALLQHPSVLLRRFPANWSLWYLLEVLNRKWCLQTSFSNFAVVCIVICFRHNTVHATIHSVCLSPPSFGCPLGAPVICTKMMATRLHTWETNLQIQQSCLLITLLCKMMTWCSTLWYLACCYVDCTPHSLVWTADALCVHLNTECTCWSWIPFWILCS